jgi:hypothetical protein
MVLSSINQGGRMKKIEIKNVSLPSVFKLFAGLFFVLGFVASLFGGGMGNARVQEFLQDLPYVGSFMGGVVGALIFGIIAALIGGLGCSLGAVLYNIFAMILGGVEIDYEERA